MCSFLGPQCRGTHYVTTENSWRRCRFLCIRYRLDNLRTTSQNVIWKCKKIKRIMFLFREQSWRRFLLSFKLFSLIFKWWDVQHDSFQNEYFIRVTVLLITIVFLPKNWLIYINFINYLKHSYYTSDIEWFFI